MGIPYIKDGTYNWKGKILKREARSIDRSKQSNRIFEQPQLYDH